MTIDTRPPEHVDLGVAVLRRHRVEEAEAMLAAIEASAEELVPWMPWALDPRTFDVGFQRERLAAREADWDAGVECSYTVLSTDGVPIGAVGVHDWVGPAALELGYWLQTSWTGRGIMSAAAGALTEAILAMPDIEQVEIRCDEGNVRSAAVPRRLGYRIDRLVEHALDAPGQTGRSLCWVYPA